jgi:hypothetical protein
MQIFPLFSATQRRNFFSTIFNSTNGVGKLATLYDINQLGTFVNNNIQFKVWDMLVSQVGVANPTYSLLASSAGVELCEGGCNVAAPCCPGQNKSEDGITAAFLRTGPGAYTVTFTVTPANAFLPLGIEAVGFSFTPFKNYGEAVTVSDRIALGQFIGKYTITTYNAGGIPTDGILDNTIIGTKLYPVY